MTATYPTHPQSGLSVSPPPSCRPGLPRLCHGLLRPLTAAGLFNSLFMYKDGTFNLLCLSALNPVAILLHVSFTSDSFLCLRYLSPVRLFVRYAGLSFPMLLMQAFTEIWFFLNLFLHPFPKALVCSTTLWQRTLVRPHYDFTGIGLMTYLIFK